MVDKSGVVVNGIVTYKGKILLGKKVEKDGHPISGEWHFPGGRIDEGEEPEEAVIRELKEETGLDVEVHQIVDATSGTNLDKQVPLMILYHCEAESDDADASDDLQDVKWVEPGKVKECLGKGFCSMVKNREEVDKFIERIRKAPY
jgi:8-oxo-dGTP diphosphatase